MRKSMRKSMHTLGAAFLISGAIVGPVSAVAKAETVSSVRSSVESSSSAAARSSKSTVVLSKMSSKKKVTILLPAHQVRRVLVQMQRL